MPKVAAPFSSRLAPVLKRYVDLKRALGALSHSSFGRAVAASRVCDKLAALALDPATARSSGGVAKNA